MAPTKSDLSFLLLLPAPPKPDTYENIKAAYESAIEAAISKVSRAAGSSRGAGVLDIAVQCPALTQRTRHVPRGALFDPVQRLLARVYSLISVISVQAGIYNVFTGGKGGVDVSVLLLELFEPHHEPEKEEILIGPVLDLNALAKSGRQWSAIYGIDGEPGNALLKSFLELSGKPLTTESLPGSVTIKESSHAASDIASIATDTARHFNVAVGGTFDHLHNGHKLLLTMTLFLLEVCPSDRLKRRVMVVGITDDELLRNKKYAEQMLSWEQRAQDTLDFIRHLLEFGKRPGKPQFSRVSEPGANGRGILASYADELLEIDCRAISDPFGPTITREELSGLVISGETRSGGKAVNDKRNERGWTSMQVFEVDVLSPHEDADQSDFANKISSTEIRKRLQLAG